ncbi:uncharacterized protein I303_105085 [Kwoniella dejecticola CBS 10117]|uniref:Coatomer subunit epsilon n=1 Tax=Kwoniella dejecticola CBS 10117 TaxID=1296121 RepID=A0AAJ8KQL7_9TREE
MELDPLYHVKQLFYQAAIEEATSQLSSDTDETLSLRRGTYIARSYLSLSPPDVSSAQKALSPYAASSSLGVKTVTAFASYLGGDKAKVDEIRDSVLEIEGNEDEDPFEEGIVRVISATVFILEGENEEAVATLNEGRGKEDLECLALLVQLLLTLDRRDLAQSAFNTAKRIGNDSILVQAIEAWIGLKTGSRPLHQSYYFYEELYQLPSGRTPPVLASHAASHLLLGHIDEAKADVLEASQKENGDKDGNVLAVGTSLGIEGYAEKLATNAPRHPFAVDLAEKSRLFDEAASKFAITA